MSGVKNRERFETAFTLSAQLKIIDHLGEVGYSSSNSKGKAEGALNAHTLLEFATQNLKSAVRYGHRSERLEKLKHAESVISTLLETYSDQVDTLGKIRTHFSALRGLLGDGEEGGTDDSTRSI